MRTTSVCLVALVGLSCRPAYAPWESAPSQSTDLSVLACIAGAVPDDVSARQTLISRLHALSVKRFRWEIPWATLERQRGVFDFSAADPKVDDFVANGIDQILILDYGNPLYSVAGAAHGNEPEYPPDDPADFAVYVSAVVTRYGAKVKKWEVWNEENSGFRFWKPDADPAAYARLLTLASAAVRRACADCEVIVGAPISIDYPSQGIQGGPDFLRAVIANGGVAGDSVGVHPYMLYPPCSPPEGGPNLCQFWPNRAEVSFSTQIETVVDAGLGRPFHASEFGWPTFSPFTGQGVVTEELQARWLVRGALLIAAQGARSACWYTLSDGPTSGSFPPEDDFGLLNNSGGQKLAFRAYADLFGALGLRHFIRDRGVELGLVRGEHALLFETARGLTTFLWRNEKTPARTVSFSLFGPASATRPGSGAVLDFNGSGATASVSLDPTAIAVTCTR